MAGTEDESSAPLVSSLRAGQSAASTEVRLEKVQSIVSLGPGSFLLFINATTEEKDATSSRLQAAWVDAGRITAVKLPDLCAGQYAVRGVRTSDTLVSLSAPAPDGDSCNRTLNEWVKVDLRLNLQSRLGVGAGLAYLDGSTLVTATRPSVDSSTVVVGRQTPPVS